MFPTWANSRPSGLALEKGDLEDRWASVAGLECLDKALIRALPWETSGPNRGHFRCSLIWRSELASWSPSFITFLPDIHIRFTGRINAQRRSVNRGGGGEVKHFLPFNVLNSFRWPEIRLFIKDKFQFTNYIPRNITFHPLRSGTSSDGIKLTIIV